MKYNLPVDHLISIVVRLLGTLHLSQRGNSDTLLTYDGTGLN